MLYGDLIITYSLIIDSNIIFKRIKELFYNKLQCIEDFTYKSFLHQNYFVNDLSTLSKFYCRTSNVNKFNEIFANLVKANKIAV